MTGTAVERHEDRPGFLDFDEAKRRAVVLAESGMVPDALRNNPSGVMLVGLYGQDLGVPFVAALSEIHVIKGRVSASAQLRLALIHRAGHEARFKQSTAEKAVIIGRRREDRDDPNGWVEVEWTIEQAEKAKLLVKDVWKQYPAEMLRARAASALCRMHFSDVLLGLDPHTPEELGADVAEVDFAPGEDEGDEDIVEAELVPDAEEAPPAEEEPPSDEQVPEGDTSPHDTKSSDGTDSSTSDEGPKDEPARPLAQQIAIQANRAGVVRGEVILAVTKGRTSSGREVTPEEGKQVLEAIAAIAAGDLELGETTIDDEDFGGERKIPALVNIVGKDKARPAPEPATEPAKAKPVAPPAPGPPPATKEPEAPAIPGGDEDTWDGNDWRAFLTARDVKVRDLIRQAVKEAKELGIAPPPNLEALKGQQSLCALLRGWVEELAETRA